ncbi:MAG: Fic/DOC family N-terminal domain-containing protein [Lachnospiraceae bacterium]|nr:Fic/DOC family N-terminal domain-containing protein [Lachnospiraceae bacterium]
MTALDVLFSRSPNMDLFVSMYVHKETLLSSQIEGPNAHWMICSILLSGETPT